MEDTYVWRGCLVIITLTGFLASSTGAQQSAKPPKPTEGAELPAASAGTAATSHPAASSQDVVLKVGTTRVTESEIDALVSKLGRRASAIVATEGRRPVAEEYVTMLVLSQQAMDEHLDSSPDLRWQLDLQPRSNAR
jgi:hypothetical protein